MNIKKCFYFWGVVINTIFFFLKKILGYVLVVMMGAGKVNILKSKKKEPLPLEQYEALYHLWCATINPMTPWKVRGDYSDCVSVDEQTGGYECFYECPPQMSGIYLDFFHSRHRTWRWNQSNSRTEASIVLQWNKKHKFPTGKYYVTLVKFGNRSLQDHKKERGVKTRVFKVWHAFIHPTPNSAWICVFHYCASGLTLNEKELPISLAISIIQSNGSENEDERQD